MPDRSRILLITIFGIPFTLGMFIVGYWYVTTRIEKKVLLPSFGTVPEFQLTSQDGIAMSRDSLLGKITIADFIFTQCAGACPLMSARMKELQETLLSDPHTRFFSFSVDPENDTPGVLRRYAGQYGAVAGKWIFLTGERTSIERLTREGFHLPVEEGADSAIVHSQKFVLIDHHAAIRGYYESDDSEAVNNLVRDARILSRRVEP
jgi:protein SCO1/2